MAVPDTVTETVPVAACEVSYVVACASGSETAHEHIQTAPGDRYQNHQR